jgi:predicted amidohydrolase YtcJ
MVVLDDDPLAVAPDLLPEIQVVQTWVGGKVGWEG